MPNCSIEVKQNVSLYRKGYSFSISKATSAPKSTCWDIVRRYNFRGHVKNRKSPGRPKNLDSKEEKQLINLSQNDSKKIQLNFYGILTRKKSCSTSLMRRILISYHFRARIAIKKPYLTPKNRLARKVWAKEHALLPKTLYPIPEWKRRICRKPENSAEKIDALGFYCPRWSEMSPKSVER